MSTTRHRPPGAERAPESYLSDPRLAGVNISLATIARTARIAPERERRAMLWLGNLAVNWERIAKVWEQYGLTAPIDAVGQMTADTLCDELGLSRVEVRSALIDPQENRTRFTAGVEKMRARFEAALPPVADIEPTRVVRDAFRYVGRMKKLGAVEGKWRAGKTTAAENLWLRNLDNTIWIDTPTDTAERTFVMRVAGSLGIGTGNAKKSSQLREQVPAALGRGLIERMIFDEAHFLMPTHPDQKPVRLEWVRELCGMRSVAALLLVTKQFADLMSEAMSCNSRWAPGQLIGRMAYYELPDAMSEEDFEAVARIHARQASDAAVRAFVAFGKISEGYVGAMVNAIQLAVDAGDGAISNGAALAAIEQQKRLSRLAEVKRAAKPPGRGRSKVVLLERSAA